MAEILIGLLGGILIGSTGAGAGLLISPLLILAGYQPAVAVGTGLGVLVAAKLVGSLAHFRLGHWPGHAAWHLLAGGVGGVVLTRALATLLLPQGIGLDLWVRRLMGMALWGMAVIFMLFRGWHRLSRAKPDIVSPIHAPLREAQQPTALFAIGLALGAPVLVTSMGSGTLLCPALLLVTDWEAPQLAAASNLFGLVVGVFSVGVHLQMGHFHRAGFTKVALGILPGVAVGTLLSRRIERSWLLVAMCVAALFLGAKLLFG
jgi:uncharacterized protein